MYWVRFIKQNVRTLVIPAILAFVFTTTTFAQSTATKDSKIEDSKITQAIDGELSHAKAVDANTIDVKVNDGIVTLSGDVKNMLTRDRSTRIASMTKGVKSVVDLMKVKSSDQTDNMIRSNIVAALAQDPATDSWEISVSTKEGQATLTGTVESYAERELAAKVAKAVRGVTDVSNNITVDYKADRIDSEIKADIEQRLNWDVRLDDEMITVEVEEGQVTLSGAIGSAYEKTLARTDAWVAGVTSVDDMRLTVNWWSRDGMQRNTAWKSLKDEDIKNAVTKAFLYDPRVSSFNPTVDVESGIVTLTGVVDNLKSKRAAAQDANNTVGVNRVKNYLKVRPPQQRTDADIQSDIAAALSRDYFVNRYEVTVLVNDGEVSLYGDVDSYYEQSQAEDLAAKVNGVTDINNYLTVSYDYPVDSYQYYDWDPVLYDYDFDYRTVTTKPDFEIKESIESNIWWSPWVSHDDVSVSVEDGIATLIGTVDTWGERNSAAVNAIEGGAVKVINKLVVDY